MSRKINFTPRAFVITAARHRTIPWGEAISELVDNSLDAGATNVTIEFTDGRSLTVRDNGCGSDDVECFFALGEHRKLKKAKLGRYGVGLKNCALAFASRLSVRTVQNGKALSCAVDWDDVERTGVCEADFSEERCADEDGTCITLSGIAKRQPVVEQMLATLGFTFAPAIRSGAVISYCGEQVKADPIPEFKQAIPVTYWFNGRGFKSIGGIIANSEFSRKESFVFSYNHRVIEQNSKPCGDYGPCGRFFAWVELLENEPKDWPLSQHKGEIEESEQVKELYDELSRVYWPLIEQARTESENLAITKICTEIALALNASSNAVMGRARRPGTRDKHGSIPPEESPRKTRRAELVNSKDDPLHEQRSGGDDGARSRGISIKLDRLRDGIGAISISKRSAHITLNINHQTIAAWVKGSNSQMLTMCALALLATHQATKSEDDAQQITLPGILGDTSFDSYNNIMSAWLADSALRYKLGITS